MSKKTTQKEENKSNSFKMYSDLKFTLVRKILALFLIFLSSIFGYLLSSQILGTVIGMGVGLILFYSLFELKDNFKIRPQGVKIFGILFLIFILMSVTYQTRSGAVDFEGSWTCNLKQSLDSSVQCGLKENIKNSLLNQIQQQIAAEVQATYPNLNQQFLIQEVQSRYLQVEESNSFQGQDLDVLVDSQLQRYVSTFQSEDNQTYLTAIDPYYYLGLSTNYYQNGHVGTTLNENGTPVVEYRLAPNGVTGTSVDLHTYVMSVMYGLNGVDKENPSYSDRMAAIFTLSAIISMLVVIPLFFLLRSVTNTPIAFISTLILVTSTIFVSRTQAGFVDTDAYNVLFPLLITALLYFSLKTKDVCSKVILSIGAGISMALFMWAWAPAWFFALFSLIALVAPMFSQGVKLLLDVNSSIKESKSKKTKKSKQNEAKSELVSLFSVKNLTTTMSSKLVFLLYFISAEILSFLLLGREIIGIIYSGLSSSVGRLTQVSSDNMWPNVLSSVAELNAASINTIFSNLLLQSTYGQIFTIIGLVGIFTFLISKQSVEQLYGSLSSFNSNIVNLLLSGISIVYFSFVVFFLKSLTVNSAELFLGLLFLPILIVFVYVLFKGDILPQDSFFIAIVSIWFVGGVYMSLNGTRFILLLVPAFVLLFSFGWFILIQELVKLLQLEFVNLNVKKTHLILSVIVCLIIYSLVSPQVDRAYAITNSNTPNFDDEWYELMDFARENTSEDAIFNSWWDFGHFFAAIGERGVTFDGASQATPASYWVGHWLMQTDEETAVDVLRMLSCSGNDGYDYVNSLFENRAEGVFAFNLINDLLGLTIDEKRELLQNYSYYSFSNTQIDSLLNLVHCEEPNQMLAITSGDMISKAGVWAHWGSWNFTRKYVHAFRTEQTVDEMSEILDISRDEIQIMVDELDEIDRQVRVLNLNRNNLENQWLAPYPSYLEPFTCNLDGGAIVNCNGQFVINLTNMSNISVEGQIIQDLGVSRVIVPNMFEYSISELNNDKELDIVLVPNPQQGSVQILAAQYPLGASMFTRLYYFNGLGTNRFENIKEVNTQTAGKVVLWDVNFNETASNLPFDISDLIQINESVLNVTEIVVNGTSENISE